MKYLFSLSLWMTFQMSQILRLTVVGQDMRGLAQNDDVKFAQINYLGMGYDLGKY